MMVLGILSGFILIAAFVYGALKFFQKGKPLYFQLLVGAVGCYAIGQLDIGITDFCYGYRSMTDFSTGMLSHVGCAVFFLTANTGALRQVLHNKASRKASVTALIAPVVYIAMLIWVVLLIIADDPFYSLTMLLYMPGAVGCYYNLLHLLSPPDDMGILKSIRGCDICMLAFAFLSNLSNLTYWLFNGSPVSYILELCAVTSLFVLVIVSEKAAKGWKI